MRVSRLRGYHRRPKMMTMPGSDPDWRNTVRWMLLLLAGAGLPAWADCVELEGYPIEGGLVWGYVEPGSRVTLDGEALDVLEDGTFLAGFHRDAGATAMLSVEGEQGCSQTIAVKSREYRISRVEGVPQRTVTPPQEHLDRIARERALVARGKRPAHRARRPAAGRPGGLRLAGAGAHLGRLWQPACI